MNVGNEKADSNLHDDSTNHTVKNWHVVADKSQFDYFTGRSAA